MDIFEEDIDLDPKSRHKKEVESRRTPEEALLLFRETLQTLKRELSG